MTVFATFERLGSVLRDWRIHITGVFWVFLPVNPRWRIVRAADPDRTIDELRDVLLDTWNSSARWVDAPGRRYLLNFALRAASGGGREIQALVDRLDARGRGPGGLDYELHRASIARQRNLIIKMHDTGQHVIGGRVPPAAPFHRRQSLQTHQPWSNVIVLSHDCSRYTVGHEVGHVLGLGEGYRDYLTYRERNGRRIASGTERRTVPGTEGSPMALPADAGPDPAAGQAEAIAQYALGALAACADPRFYGPEVDGYRARVGVPG